MGGTCIAALAGSLFALLLLTAPALSQEAPAPPRDERDIIVTGRAEEEPGGREVARQARRYAAAEHV
jgi:uncharacterized protein YggE